MRASDLERENEITLYAVQALLGLIATETIAVAVLVEAEGVELTFWVHRQTAEVEDDVDQAVFELDALFSGDHPLIVPRIHVGDPDPPTLRKYRMIYWAKS